MTCGLQPEQLMADKMRLYAGDEDIDLEELERALTIVRRKMANPESFPGFLDNPEVPTQLDIVLPCGVSHRLVYGQDST